LFTYLFLLANCYHVNKQSIGIWRIFGLHKDKSLEATFDLFTVNGVYLFYHFYYVKSKDLDFSVGAIILLISVLIYTFFKHKREKNFSLQYCLLGLQGNLIFWPLCLTSNVLIAFAIGISIHYLQYIIITGSIFKIERSVSKVLIFCFFYSLIATYLQSYPIEGFKWIILIPVILQLLHFYLDGLFWKLSEKKIKERVFPVLKN